jgi:hypothetical protein
MTNALVQAGDVRGAWAIADHMTSSEERGLFKGIIVAQQIAAGDLLGAKATFLRFSPREITGRDSAAGAIAHALVTEGNIEEALRFVCHMETGELRMSVLREVFRVQIERGGRTDTERLAAGLENNGLRDEASTVIQTLEQGCDEDAHILKACAMNFTHDTFANVYPVE